MSSGTRNRIGPARGGVVLGITGIICVLVLSACSSAKKHSGNAPSTETDDIAVVTPFSGTNASYGPLFTAGCKAAVYEVNRAGGADGHQLKCTAVDTIADPVDGVAAVRKMLATDSHVAGVIGPDGNTAQTVVPILNAAHITMMATNGSASFDQNKLPYYWRTVPADDVLGVAMAVAAHDANYTRGAALFTNDEASQAQVPTLVAAFTKLGGTVTSNQSVAPNSPNYRTEVSKLLSGNPQVIFTETDPATAATLYKNLKELETTPIPIIGTGTDTQAPYRKAIYAAVGSSWVNSVFSGVNFYAPAAAQNLGLTAYNAAVLAPGAGIPDPKQYVNDPYGVNYYDGGVIMALAMEAAHSTVPAIYNTFIAKVTVPTGPSSAIVVHTFAEGKAALAKGEQIQYIGASGPIPFNQFHNTVAPFVVQTFGAGSSLTNGRIITTQEVAQAS